MKMTEEGLAMIRRFEGFRPQAYRDVAGVWTIGFGHTSMAGPPVVTPGLAVTLAEATTLLERDVAVFAAGVASAVTVPLSDAQFSALVSFSYNVGLAAFRRSGVLRAVNAGDFAAVPQRLGQWVKAGGRTLPGLVKRRAAEGEMFASGPKLEPASSEPNFTAPKQRPPWAKLSAVLRFLRNCLRNPNKEGL